MALFSAREREKAGKNGDFIWAGSAAQHILDNGVDTVGCIENGGPSGMLRHGTQHIRMPGDGLHGIPQRVGGEILFLDADRGPRFTRAMAL